MNSNLFHNLANVVIALLTLLTAVLVATGCQALATGALDCSKSFLSPELTAIAAAAISALKIVVNIFRDGIAGLTKPQPPVGS